MYRFVFALAFVSAIMWTHGCTPGPKAPPAAVPVKGTVNVDGKPLASGEIRFSVVPFPPKTMEIKDGAFSGEASEGKNQVEVVSVKDEGWTTTEPKTKIQTNQIADKFSGPNTPLHAEVTKGGTNDFKFEVNAKK